MIAGDPPPFATIPRILPHALPLPTPALPIPFGVAARGAAPRPPYKDRTMTTAELLELARKYHEEAPDGFVFVPFHLGPSHVAEYASDGGVPLAVAGSLAAELETDPNMDVQDANTIQASTLADSIRAAAQAVPR